MTDNENSTAEETITEAIDGAEEVRDPLEGLVEKTKLDPGAPFTPEVLERLAALKKDDRAAFEKLRAQLKKAGCRVTALDEALAEESGERRRARAAAGGHTDRHRASRRAVSHPRRNRLCRPRHRRPSRNLADPLQGLSRAGWPAATSSRPTARQIPRRCNRRLT